MKLNNAAQNLLDRYLLAVRRALTVKNRADITAEIRSFLLDNLEGRYPKTKELSENQVKQELEKMGSPRKLAAQFSPQRYLIGPRFFYAYLLVLKIVVLAVIVALTLALIIRTLAGGLAIGVQPVVEVLGTLWSGAFSAAAFVTLVFAILERVNQGRDLEELADLDKFDLNDLPDLGEEEKEPTIAGNIFEIVMCVIGLAFLTYIFNSGGQLPIFTNLASKMVQVRVFTEGFMGFVPLMMALTGLGIARSATLLVQRHRTSLTAWWRIGSEIASIVLTVFLLGAFPLITVQGFQSLPFPAAWDFIRTDSAINIGLKVILILSMVGSLVDIVRALIREVRNPAG
jgi:hypothetical protein